MRKAKIRPDNLRMVQPTAAVIKKRDAEKAAGRTRPVA